MDSRNDKKDNKRTFVSGIIFFLHAAPRLALLKRRSPLKHLIDRKAWSEGVVAGWLPVGDEIRALGTEKRSACLTGAEYKLGFVSPAATPVRQINIEEAKWTSWLASITDPLDVK